MTTVYECNTCKKIIPIGEIRGTPDNYYHWDGEDFCIGIHKKEYKWKYCMTCHKWYIECPICGNNCCNATFGYMDKEMTIPCPDKCNSAYTVQDAEIGMPKGVKSAIGIFIVWLKEMRRQIKWFIHHGTWGRRAWLSKEDRWTI
jgi:hypothetical protein